jgi:hypothetical protein
MFLGETDDWKVARTGRLESLPYVPMPFRHRFASIKVLGGVRGAG